VLSRGQVRTRSYEHMCAFADWSDKEYARFQTHERLASKIPLVEASLSCTDENVPYIFYFFLRDSVILNSHNSHTHTHTHTHLKRETMNLPIESVVIECKGKTDELRAGYSPALLPGGEGGFKAGMRCLPTRLMV